MIISGWRIEDEDLFGVVAEPTGGGTRSGLYKGTIPNVKRLRAKQAAALVVLGSGLILRRHGFAVGEWGGIFGEPAAVRAGRGGHAVDIGECTFEVEGLVGSDGGRIRLRHRAGAEAGEDTESGLAKQKPGEDRG